MSEEEPKSRLSYCKGIVQQRLSDAITALTPRRRFSCIPIRVPYSSEDIEVHPVYSALQEFLNRTFLNLYALDQALLHSDSKGGHFQRSPSNPGLLSLRIDAPEPQTFATTLHLEHVEDAQTADQIRVLYNLRHCLAVFLSQFYMEIDKFGKTMSQSSEKSFASLLITLNDYISKLEASISAIGVGDLSFDKLYDYRDHWPDVKTWDEQWSDYNTENALSVMDTNLNKLDEYISTVGSSCALQEFLNRTFLSLYTLDQALLHSDSKGGHFQRSPSNPDLLSIRIDVPEPQTFATTLHLEHVADAQIADHIRVLYNLRHSLAVFLSQFYMEIDKFGKTMSQSSEKSFASLLITLNDYISKLEASISAIGVGYLSFDKLNNYRDQWPDVNTWDDQWSDYNTENALSVMDTNLNKLDEYISMVVSKYRKPRKITQNWMPYIFGAIGISIFSVWLIRSGIVDNWVLEAKKIFSGEQAVTAVRDEVLETMRSRQKEGMKQVQSTSKLLHSMLLDSSERIKGEKTPSNVSGHELLESATTSFKEQLKHPIRNLIWGELPRLFHIQLLKQTHDIEVSMCELNHKMLMDYETKSPFIPSLRTISVSFGALMIPLAWVRQTKEKRSRARVKRRLLLDELEERIMEFQNVSLLNEHGHYINGLVLYTLDRLYKAVERLAKAAGEWKRVRNDITFLGDACLEMSDKLFVTSRLYKAYECLQPETQKEFTLRMDVEKHRRKLNGSTSW